MRFLIVCIYCLFPVAMTMAQEAPEYQKLAEQAAQEAKSKNYDKAVNLYLQAYNKSKDKIFLYNIAVLYHFRLDDHLKAFYYGIRYKQYATSDEEIKEADDLLNQIEQRLRLTHGKVIVDCGETDKVWIDDKIENNRVILGVAWVEPKDHTVICALSDNKEEKRDIQVNAGDIIRIQIGKKPMISKHKRIVEFSFGAKMTVGGNIWTHPSDTPPDTDIGFSETRGGWGIGGGVSGEIIFVKYIGLMTEFLFEKNYLWENDTIYKNGYEIDFTPKASAVFLRIPILIRGYLPLPGIRLSIGLGPEFVVPLSSSATLEKARTVITPKDMFKVKTKTSTMLTMDFGMAIHIWNGLIVPINIRGSYNLTQPKSWLDRVDLHPGNEGFTLLYQNSWDLRLLLGLGYNL